MDIPVEWSPEAIEDLDAIEKYIARSSPRYGRSVANKITGTAATIAAFPEIGRIVPEIGNDRIRERFVFSYRIIYRIEDRRIVVVAVIHGKRLLENVSERFDSFSD